MFYPAAILLLLVLSSLFSSCETAFSSVNKIRLKSEAMQGNKKAEKALALAESFDRALTAILIGNNLVNILSASLGTILFTKWFGQGGVGISTAAMTVLVLIFGEILPKSYAKAHAEKMALFFASPLHGLIVILTPLIFLLNQLSKLVQKKSGEPLSQRMSSRSSSIRSRKKACSRSRKASSCAPHLNLTKYPWTRCSFRASA